MTRIKDLFRLHRAKSGLFSDYEPGDVAYVGNGMNDNAVVGYVSPRQRDAVFGYPAIAVSAFCEATVQLPPFIACGRAGNGLVVLEPRSPMPLEDMAALAAYINLAIRWRFNWYRQVTADRLINQQVPAELVGGVEFEPAKSLPLVPDLPASKILTTDSRKFRLDDLFHLQQGNYHSLNQLGQGSTPVISCGYTNNGIAGFFDVPNGPLHKDRLTVALNGSPLTAKYHHYEFAAKDDVAVCMPKNGLRLSTVFFIGTVLNRERWRYSYYRKCYMGKLQRFEIKLPCDRDAINEDAIETTLDTAAYWPFVKAFLEKDYRSDT